MTDSPQWQPPGQTPAAPAPFVSPTGTAPLGTPPPSAGWTPPPKPGLIPLRPLEFGTLLGAAFRVMRRNPRPTLGTALVVQGIVYLASLLIVGGVSYLSFSRLAASDSQDYNQILAGTWGAIALSAIVPIVLSVAASAFLEGIIVLEVMRATLGEKARLRELYGRARGRIGALIGWTVLVILAITIAVAVIAGLVAVLIITLGVAGIVIGVLLGIFGGLGLLATWVWLSTKLALVPSVLMAERVSIRSAMGRSWALTRQSFWKTFGILLLVSAIISIATQVVSTPISFISPLILGLADPSGQNPGVAVGGAIVMAVLLGIISVVFGAVGAVVQSSTIALIYIDLRMRKEGLDLELSRFVEARQSGSSSLSDPYAPPASAAAPNSPTPPTSPTPPASPTNDSPWA